MQNPEKDIKDRNCISRIVMNVGEQKKNKSNGANER